MELQLTPLCSLPLHHTSAHPKASATTSAAAATASCSVEALKPRPELPRQPLHRRRRNRIHLSSVCAAIERLVADGRYREACDALRTARAVAPFEALPASTYDALVTAASALREAGAAAAVLWHMESSGFELDQYTWNRVLGMHLACGMLTEARRLFDGMPTRSQVTWGVMMGGLVDGKRPCRALALFAEFWEDFGVDAIAGPRVLVVAVRAAAVQGSVCVGQELHCCIAKMGMCENQHLLCALIDMYSKCGRVDEARRVFDGIPRRSVVAWNTMLAAYSLHGYSEEALGLYHDMCDSGVGMDQFTFSTMLRVFSRLGLLEHAKQIHAGLIQRDCLWTLLGIRH